MITSIGTIDWLRLQVQEAIDDPRSSIPHEQVLDEWNIERAALLRQLTITTPT